MIWSIVVFTSILGLVNAECPNGCSSHGKCTAYDMCLCYRNWMANDCSERICQFGLAHVDTPKGDLDASSGELDGPSSLVAVNSEMYPYGTTEQFPNMADANSAHYYMECSNKGICDRGAGTCECFPGYEGSACQRASCPSGAGGVCSGHGTCEDIKQISRRDSANIYELWDEHSTLGCVCDPGYYGADCALRECKYGADPLYFDDNANIRYSNWTIMFAAESGALTLSGTWSIIFYDHFGEDWHTSPLAADADCDDVITALEDIPNDVVPDQSVRCREYSATDPDWAAPAFFSTQKIFKKFVLLFPENPGQLKQIAINSYLDGARPTLYTDELVSTLETYVYADGFHGEDFDAVPDECENVLVSFSTAVFTGDGVATYSLPVLTFPAGQSSIMSPLLKRCLGHSDNDLTYYGTSDEVYQWDYGTPQNPHLVKFVDTSITSASRHCLLSTASPACPAEATPAGFFAPVIFKLSTTAGVYEYAVFSNAPNDYPSTSVFRVFTTKGYLNRVNNEAEFYTRHTGTTQASALAAGDVANWFPNTVYSFNKGSVYNSGISLVSGYATAIGYPLRHNEAGNSEWSGNVDCESGPMRSVVVEDCLQKNDWVMFFSTQVNAANQNANPKYHNLYQVTKIYREYPTVDTPSSLVEEQYRNRIVLNMNVNFMVNLVSAEYQARLQAYKFYPAPVVTSYVEQCSGRGLCNSAEGICECFPGYTNDDCSVQSAGAQ